MKICSVAALVGFATSFALPIFAQEKEEVKPFPFTPVPAGPQLVQQIEAINQKFDEAFNKHDAAAVGALYTANAVQKTPQGSFSGREASYFEFTPIKAQDPHRMSSRRLLRSMSDERAHVRTRSRRLSRWRTASHRWEADRRHC